MMKSKSAKTFRACVWTAIITTIVVLIGVFILSEGCDQSNQDGTVVVAETLSVKEIIADTVIRWRERLVWKKAQPETIWVSPETLDADTIWGVYPEAIIALDYGKGNLTFTSLVPVDRNDTGSFAVSREYAFKVSGRFAIRARGDGFFVKTRLGFWDKFYGGLAGGGSFKLLGDSTVPFLDPYLKAYIGWGPVAVGPRLNLHGIGLAVEVTRRF